ncbi:carboxymuconolactone decarboxylase family protein [Thiohalomonas denitrificans]|uniref:carboxymuconolactone decarboxylase family protein n=1 Tax=Thiohalomonas denitrificans TaxID=415747 RepID=UPI0026EEA685|nr:carboxymuconolactone decarboxylase family protein [Thiohalomonas denitrificans]
MMSEQAPKPGWHQSIQERYPGFIEAVDELGAAVRKAGPLEDKMAHLVQLGAAAALRSEGAVHSHARRALESGATPDEVRHAIILVTSTIGFPNVAAALSWVDDVVAKHR